VKPSPRLRRVLAIARLTALWAYNTRLYQTDVNAWRRWERTQPPLRAVEGDDGCPF